MDTRKELDIECDSRIQRSLKAREYKQLCKELYVVSKVRFYLFLSLQRHPSDGNDVEGVR
jgi:hypothetical protein